jgi:hypothetical protein
MQLILHSILKIRIDSVGLETVAYESYEVAWGTNGTITGFPFGFGN